MQKTTKTEECPKNNVAADNESGREKSGDNDIDPKEGDKKVGEVNEAPPESDGASKSGWLLHAASKSLSLSLSL